MKKQLFSALSALTVMGALFTSCSQDELILDEPTVSQQDLQPIEFTLDVASSRGIDAKLINISSIYIYGFYEKEVTDGEGNTTTQVFDCFTEKDGLLPNTDSNLLQSAGIPNVQGNIVEFKKGNDDVFAPAQTIYWKNEWGNNVTFMAIAHGPFGATLTSRKQFHSLTRNLQNKTMLTSVVAANGDIKIEGNVADHICEQLDLVTAKTTTNKKEAKNGIELVFKHSFAQVQVKFKSAEESDYTYELFGASLVTQGYGDTGTFSVAEGKFTEVAAADQNSYWTAKITNIDNTAENIHNEPKGALQVGPVAKGFPAFQSGNEGAYIIPGSFTAHKPKEGSEPKQAFQAGDLYMRLFVIARNKENNSIAYPSELTENKNGTGPNQYLDFEVKDRSRRGVRDEELKLFNYFTIGNGDASDAVWAKDKIGVSIINFDAITFEAGHKYVYTIDLTDGIGHYRPDDPERPDEPVLGVELKAKITVEAFNEDGNPIELKPNKES
ncbi:MAG: fimbrillin family protein [Muribaculaceae bacterium]|nr:fimbrillin family protein [Muribaculaceae bacterium]